MALKAMFSMAIVYAGGTVAGGVADRILDQVNMVSDSATGLLIWAEARVEEFGKALGSVGTLGALVLALLSFWWILLRVAGACGECDPGARIYRV